MYIYILTSNIKTLINSRCNPDLNIKSKAKRLLDKQYKKDSKCANRKENIVQYIITLKLKTLIPQNTSSREKKGNL